MLTLVFLWMSSSSYAADATRKLTAWFVSGDIPEEGGGDGDMSRRDSPLLLLEVDDGEGGLVREAKFDGRFGGMFVGALAWLKGDLRLRLLLMAAVLWVGNLIHR